MASAASHWDVRTREALAVCVDESFREVYGYAGLVAGDRDTAEALVVDVYGSLSSAVEARSVEWVSLGLLRGAVRARWVGHMRSTGLDHPLDTRRPEIRPARTLAELTDLERTVTVMRFVNHMPPDRVADELGLDEARIESIESVSVRRLRGSDDRSGTWVKAFFGDALNARPGIRTRLVTETGDRRGRRR